MDGWVTIGTKLDTKDFDMKYEKLSRDVEKKELNIDIKTQQAEQTKRELESINRQLEETENELSDIAEKAERFPALYGRCLYGWKDSDRTAYDDEHSCQAASLLCRECADGSG